MSDYKNESKYLQFLPGIYQTGEADGFLGRFLKAFENILSEYSLFKVEIKDAASLASKLKEAESPISQYIVARFSDETKQLLDEFDGTGSPSKVLYTALADELNSLIFGESIYEENRFKEINLSATTRELLNQNLKGNDLARLNMLLLKEAFPNEITKWRGFEQKGIEEILNQIHDFFDPNSTPLEFLPWLAGWMALVLKEEDEWNESNARKKRDLIAKIIPLYQKRGTLDGLRKYIRIYVGEDVKISINEFLDPLQVAMTSAIGVNTVVGEGRPYYFQVYMELAIPSLELLEKKSRAIKEIIDQEKPAHTYYNLQIVVPTMQIGVHSTVGVDTLLGIVISE